MESIAKKKAGDEKEAEKAADSTRKRLNRSMHVPKSAEDYGKESN
jgi:hypothetical protein